MKGDWGTYTASERYNEFIDVNLKKDKKVWREMIKVKHRDGSIVDRLIIIFFRVAFVTVWIIGGEFAVMFVLLSFYAYTFHRQVMINSMAFGFLVFSCFCHKLLNWILTRSKRHNSEKKNFHISVFLTGINVNYKAFCLVHPKLHKHSSLVP